MSKDKMLARLPQKVWDWIDCTSCTMITAIGDKYVISDIDYETDPMTIDEVISFCEYEMEQIEEKE